MYYCVNQRVNLVSNVCHNIVIYYYDSHSALNFAWSNSAYSWDLLEAFLNELVHYMASIQSKNSSAVTRCQQLNLRSLRNYSIFSQSRKDTSVLCTACIKSSYPGVINVVKIFTFTKSITFNTMQKCMIGGLGLYGDMRSTNVSFVVTSLN